MQVTLGECTDARIYPQSVRFLHIFSLIPKFQNTFLLRLWLTASLFYVISYISLSLSMSSPKSPLFKACFAHSACHISKKRNLALISKYRTKALLSDSSNFYLAKHYLAPIFSSLSHNNFTDFHSFVLYEGRIKSQVTELYLHAVCLTYNFL